MRIAHPSLPCKWELTKWELTKWELTKWEADQMGIDEVGIEVGINQERTLSTSYYLRCWLVFKSTEVLVNFQEY